jgi:hypothetical protein
LDALQLPVPERILQQLEEPLRKPVRKPVRKPIEQRLMEPPSERILAPI